METEAFFECTRGQKRKFMNIPETPSRAASDSGENGPTRLNERIEILDILRGFAILGILVVNFEGYGFSTFFGTDIMDRWPGFGDHLAESLIVFFATGKFNILFTFLFGLGFALQMQRAERQGQSIPRRYSRRLLGLLCIGLAHKFLLWAGDILVAYALMGFVLLLFRHAKERTLLVCSLLLYGAALMPWELNQIQSTIRGNSQATHAEQKRASEKAPDLQETEQEVIRDYAHGNFRELMAVRYAEAIRGIRLGYNSFAHVLALFLLGLYAGKKRIFEDLNSNRRLFSGLLLWGPTIGVSAELALHFLYWKGLPIWCGMLRPVMFGLGTVALSAGYVALLVKLTSVPQAKLFLGALAKVGRIALTNYVLQSVICTFIFYSFGFRLYGQIGPMVGLELTFAIYVAEVWLSRWWLGRARYGPLEWVLRSITYRQIQPMWMPKSAHP
jgi:uncharacterized protein